LNCLEDFWKQLVEHDAIRVQRLEEDSADGTHLGRLSDVAGHSDGGVHQQLLSGRREELPPGQLGQPLVPAGLKNLHLDGAEEASGHKDSVLEADDSGAGQDALSADGLLQDGPPIAVVADTDGDQKIFFVLELKRGSAKTKKRS